MQIDAIRIYGTFTPDISTKAGVIAALAEYGVTAYEAGVPAQQPVIDGVTLEWSLLDGRIWTLEELQQVLVGVQKTAGAFSLTAYGVLGDPTGTNAQAKALFKTIMGDTRIGNTFYLLRVEDSFSFVSSNPSADPCYGSAGVGCTNNGNAAIALYGNFYIDVNDIQYTVVHELGHRFDNQSDLKVNGLDTLSLKERLSGLTSPLYECGKDRSRDNKNDNNKDNDDDGIVIGPVGDNWRRGVRGWGTPRASNPPPQTSFQKNPLDEDRKTDAELRECFSIGFTEGSRTHL